MSSKDVFGPSSHPSATCIPTSYNQLSGVPDCVGKQSQTVITLHNITLMRCSLLIDNDNGASCGLKNAHHAKHLALRLGCKPNNIHFLSFFGNLQMGTENLG